MKLSEHFDLDEFRCLCGKCGPLTTDLVDRSLVDNLERLRSMLNDGITPGDPEHPIIITSGARCWAHNRAVGGRSASMHLYNPALGVASKAADVYSPGVPLGDLYRAALKIPEFKGIGLAPPVAADPARGLKGRVGYLHLDTRAQSSRVMWGYDERGSMVALASVLPVLFPGGLVPGEVA